MHVPVEVAHRARALAAELDADGCVAVGGGSAIGLGKAIALEHGLPVVAVPDHLRRFRDDPDLGPDRGREPSGPAGTRGCCRRSVIYDPELTVTLPVGAVGDQRLQRDRPRRRGTLRPRRHPGHLPDGRGGRPGPDHRTAQRSSLTAPTWTPDPRPSTAAWLCGAVPRRHHDVAAPQALSRPRRHASTCPTPRPTPSSCRTSLAYNAAAAPDAVAALARALGAVPTRRGSCGTSPASSGPRSRCASSAWTENDIPRIAERCGGQPLRQPPARHPRRRHRTSAALPGPANHLTPSPTSRRTPRT